MKRSGPLRPSRVPTAQRLALPKVNAQRKAKREAAGEVYGPYHAHMATLPCLLRGFKGHVCIGTVCGHHLKSVGAGGKDAANEVPMCERAHRAVHVIGRRLFDEFEGVDLRALAASTWALWVRQAGA